MHGALILYPDNHRWRFAPWLFVTNGKRDQLWHVILHYAFAEEGLQCFRFRDLRDATLAAREKSQGF